MPLKDDKLLIVAFTGEAGDSGGGWHRNISHLEILQRHRLAHARLIAPGEDRKVSDAALLNADVLISHGVPNEELSDLVLNLIATGKKVVWDVDDDVRTVSPWNFSYRKFGTEEVEIELPGGGRKTLWEACEDPDPSKAFTPEKNKKEMDVYDVVLKRCHALTTTQPYLANRLRELNPNVYVRPNHADFSFVWRSPPRKNTTDQIRICYMGGSSHYADLYDVMPALRHIAEKYPHVRFQFFGDTAIGQGTDRLPEGRVDRFPWEPDVGTFALKLRAIRPDIGIAPLSRGQGFAEFNRCKSALKWIDYACVGVPCVAQDMTPYKEAISYYGVPELEWDGVLAGETDEWIHALEMLIEHREAREVIGANAYRMAREEWNADICAPIYLKQYEAIIHGNDDVQYPDRQGRRPGRLSA